MYPGKTSEGIPLEPGQSAIGADYRQNSVVRKIRRILLILLGIQLILATAYFIEKIVDLVKHKQASDHGTAINVYYNTTISPLISTTSTLSTTTKTGPFYYGSMGTYIGSVVAAAISLIYIILFIIVVVKYIRIGILIFAWLGLVELICIVIVIVFTIIAVIAGTAAIGAVGVGIGVSVLIIVVAAISCLLTILTVIYAFKLAKEIKQHEAYQSV